MTIRFEGLRDDSVTAERRIVTLERDGESWRVINAGRKCHSGRGQQDFAPELGR